MLELVLIKIATALLAVCAGFFLGWVVRGRAEVGARREHLRLLSGLMQQGLRAVSAPKAVPRVPTDDAATTFFRRATEADAAETSLFSAESLDSAATTVSQRGEKPAVRFSPDAAREARVERVGSSVHRISKASRVRGGCDV